MLFSESSFEVVGVKRGGLVKLFSRSDSWTTFCLPSGLFGTELTGSNLSEANLKPHSDVGSRSDKFYLTIETIVHPTVHSLHYPLPS